MYVTPRPLLETISEFQDPTMRWVFQEKL